jgi:hypothetical protein
MALEAETAQETPLPVTWLAAESDSATTAFGTAMHPRSGLDYAPDVKRKLKIQAVPAAFLVGSDDVVRAVWVYHGDENHDELREKCT